MSESLVSKWEQNRSNPDITVLPILSEILKVSEHELITASVDSIQRDNNINAKKWNSLKTSWNMFFYIAYGITILTCFIVNLAVSKTLSWFFIVLSALILSSVFTILPGLLKRYKLFIIPTSALISLITLLLICNIYTNGTWFYLVLAPIILGYMIVFLPIYIHVYKFPKFIKKYKEIILLFINGLVTVFTMYIIQLNTNSIINWTKEIAIPLIIMGGVVSLFIIVITKYLPINGYLKSGIVLSFITIIHPLILLKTEDVLSNSLDLNKQQTYIPNFNIWQGDYINNIIQFILLLVLLVTSITFLVIGFIKNKNNYR